MMSQGVGVEEPSLLSRSGYVDASIVSSSSSSTSLSSCSKTCVSGDDIFQKLIEKQDDIFRTTLPKYNETFESEQELRQTCLVQKFSEVTVHVAREEFLHIRATVTVRFVPEAAQAAWDDFLSQCRAKLGIDFIDSVYDKFDMSPVHRILRLQNGGHYIVRQREESSVLEVIQSGVRPGKVVWPITKFINSAKDVLSDLQTHQPGMEDRVKDLVRRPLVRSRQRKICSKLLNSTTPAEIMKIMLELVEHREPKPSDPPEVVAFIEKDNKKKADSEVDYVSIYRTFLESLNRVALRGYMEEAGDNDILTYVLSLLDRLKEEVDIVVLGMKLMSDLVKSLALRTDEIFHVIMNCAQLYSPPPQPGFVRVLKRNIPTTEEVERKQREKAEKLARELMEEEERNMRELNAKILAKEKAAEEEKKAAVKTKISVSTVDLAAQRRQEANRRKVQKRIAKAEKRAKAAADRRLQGSAPVQANDNNDTPPIYFPPVKEGVKLAKMAVPTISRANRSNPAQTASSAAKKPFKAPENSKRVADPNEEKKKQQQRKASVWQGFGADVVWDDEDVREGDYDPLPVVDGVKFTGIAGETRRNLAFSQCIMTMGKFCFASYTYREYAFNMGIHEELCDLGLVCQHLPSVLTFIVWITDKVLQDKYEEEVVRFKAAESRRKNLAAATKNDESESNLSMDSNNEGRKVAMDIITDRHIADLTRPSGNILLFFSMCYHMHDLEMKDIKIVEKWLSFYQDDSKEYADTRKKGLELAGL